LDCAPSQQREILDLISFRHHAESSSGLQTGVQFFGFLRRLTTDDFFTSEIGIEYLGCKGNDYLADSPGCPSVPQV
jgi:hypothetical protein